VLTPTFTGFDTLSEVVVVSEVTVRTSTALVDPAKAEPGAGVKVAVRLRVAAANEIWQAPVTLCPLDETGTFVHPSSGTPPSATDTHPDSATPLRLAVTVATKVTTWLVTAVPGTAMSVVVVPTDGARPFPPTTTAVRLLLAEALPAKLEAVTTALTVWPTSAARSA
jgi:hypothetical protein